MHQTGCIAVVLEEERDRSKVETGKAVKIVDSSAVRTKKCDSQVQLVAERKCVLM